MTWCFQTLLDAPGGSMGCGREDGATFISHHSRRRARHQGCNHVQGWTRASREDIPDEDTLRESWEMLVDEDAISKGGPFPIVVELDMELDMEADMSPEDVEQQRQDLRDMREGIINQFLETVTRPNPDGGEVPSRDRESLGLKVFNLSPSFAMQAYSWEIDLLNQHEDVLYIVGDAIAAPDLIYSVPHIGVNETDWTFRGYDGVGQVIAVLDTGVNFLHPFLANKVVAQACYSTNFIFLAGSLCPFGETEAIGGSSGAECASADGCDHGTHVAGIVAGSDSTRNGVAKSAELISVQVFSQITANSACSVAGKSGPCLLTFNSDITSGLEQVYNWRDSHNIVGVNLSLSCRGPRILCRAAMRRNMRNAIKQLRAAGIVSIASSGNDGKTDRINRPADFPEAVSVGSTDIKTPETVAPDSNSDDNLDLLAPGAKIVSSGTSQTGWVRKSGTSMAAPHVAGAWAVLKQAKPSASIDEILNVLKTTGVSITDTRSGAGNRVTPRIQLDAALDMLVPLPPPPPPPPPPEPICTVLPGNRTLCIPGWIATLSLKFKLPWKGCENLDRDSLQGLGGPICIAYERTIPHGRTVMNTCFHDSIKCVRGPEQANDGSAEVAPSAIQFNVHLGEERLVRELKEFVTSTRWDEFQAVIEREAGPELSEQLEGMSVAGVGVHSLQTGTEDGPLEDQRRQNSDPSFVAELQMSIQNNPGDTFQFPGDAFQFPGDAFQTGKILAPDINFFARVSVAMSIAMDDKAIDDFTVLRVFEELGESRVIRGLASQKIAVHVLVDCSTSEEAQELGAVLQDLPSSELQKAFEEMIEGVREVQVAEVVPLYDPPEQETTPAPSSGRSLSQSRGLMHQVFVHFHMATFLGLLLF